MGIEIACEPSNLEIFDSVRSFTLLCFPVPQQNCQCVWPVFVVVANSHPKWDTPQAGVGRNVPPPADDASLQMLLHRTCLRCHRLGGDLFSAISEAKNHYETNICHLHLGCEEVCFIDDM